MADYFLTPVGRGIVAERLDDLIREVVSARKAVMESRDGDAAEALNAALPLLTNALYAVKGLREVDGP